MKLITSALRTAETPSVPRISIDGTPYLRMKELSELLTADTKAPIAAKMAQAFREACPHHCTKVPSRSDIYTGWYVMETCLPLTRTFMTDPARLKEMIGSFYAINTWSKSQTKPVTATDAKTAWTVDVLQSTKARIAAYAKSNGMKFGDFLTAAIDVFEQQSKQEAGTSADAVPVNEVAVETVGEKSIFTAPSPGPGVETIKKALDERDSKERFQAVNDHIVNPLKRHISEEIIGMIKIQAEILGEQEMHFDKRLDNIEKLIHAITPRTGTAGVAGDRYASGGGYSPKFSVDDIRRALGGGGFYTGGHVVGGDSHFGR